MSLSFAVIRGARAFVLSVATSGDAIGTVVLKGSGVPFAFDPDDDVVTTEGAITSAMTRRGTALLTGSSVSMAALELRPGRFAGIGARELVYGHPNFDPIEDKDSLIDAIYTAAGVESTESAAA